MNYLMRIMMRHFVNYGTVQFEITGNQYPNALAQFNAAIDSIIEEEVKTICLKLIAERDTLAEEVKRVSQINEAQEARIAALEGALKRCSKNAKLILDRNHKGIPTSCLLTWIAAQDPENCRAAAALEQTKTAKEEGHALS